MSDIRIGTWNVAYAAGIERNAARLRRLRTEKADIWVLTETRDTLDLADTHTAVRSEPRAMRPSGSRWTVIWTRWPVLERVPTTDPQRTVAAVIEAPSGPLVIYGTVLPWHADGGPAPDQAARGWAEQDRILPIQLAEWRTIQDRFPEAPLIVAGDLNMNLGGPHYYGTARGRTALQEGLRDLGLGCATTTGDVPPGLLRAPPIDHVLVRSAWLPRTRVVSAWEGDADGVKLSDHSGLMIEVTSA